MPRLESNKEFIRKLSEHAPVQISPSARVIGMGEEAVVVASGDSVLKCYSINVYDRTGFRISSREKAALRSFGGYTGQDLNIPAFKSYHRFPAFNWNGRVFTCVTEQSRMAGKVLPQTEIEDPVKLGRALGEFHSLLAARPHFFKAANYLVANAIGWCISSDEKNGLDMDLREPLKKRLKPIVQKGTAVPVHGDFHHHNVLHNGLKYSFLDHSRTGISYAEHDMSQFAIYPGTLRGMFKGYAQVTGVRLKMSNVVSFYALDLAQLSVQHKRKGDTALATDHADLLRAVLS